MLSEKWKKRLFGTLKIIISLAVMLFCLEYLGIRNIWAWIILIAFFTTWRMWKMRQSIMIVMRQLEMMIWSKPLDRDMWTKEEWKNRPKTKIVWKKKDGKQKTKANNNRSVQRQRRKRNTSSSKKHL